MHQIALHCGHKTKLQVSSVFIGSSSGASNPWRSIVTGSSFGAAASPKPHAYSPGSPYPPSCLFAHHKRVYHHPIGRSDVRELWLAGKDMLPTCLIGPLLHCLHQVGGPQHCFGMVYLWFLLCQCIQEPQWQHVGEMGFLG
jgi:hypothetical protein